jgi:L-fuculose-phosphate aldolase
MRSEVVRIGRLLLARGLVTGTQGNVSARDGDAILITPSAQPYDEMEPGDVVVLGRPSARPPSSEWRVHAAIYEARPDVGAIVHTHSPAATAWAHREEPLAPEVTTAAWAETGTEALAVHAVRALGDRDAVLLARHGVVGVGPTLDEALAVCERVEALARDRAQRSTTSRA